MRVRSASASLTARSAVALAIRVSVFAGMAPDSVTPSGRCRGRWRNCQAEEHIGLVLGLPRRRPAMPWWSLWPGSAGPRQSPRRLWCRTRGWPRMTLCQGCHLQCVGFLDETKEAATISIKPKRLVHPGHADPAGASCTVRQLTITRAGSAWTADTTLRDFAFSGHESRWGRGAGKPETAGLSIGILWGFWWRGLDSNQRRRAPTDLQSVPFSLSGTPPYGTGALRPSWPHCQRTRPRPHHQFHD